MKIKNVNFNNKIYSDYDLQNKHLFKKKAGKAKWYYQLVFKENLDKDLKALHEIYKLGIPFKILGLHTNLYITDNGYNGIFVDISHKNAKIIFDEENKTFTVTSNVTVSEFINYAMEKGYDFSDFAGVPGFVGSGVVGNSGFGPSKKDFSNFVQEITVYDFEKGNITKINPDKEFFEERNSFIKQQNKTRTRYFIKEVVLKLDCIEKNIIKEKFDAQITKREKSLKFGFQEGTAGSLWSNAHLRKIVGKSFPNMLRENSIINANFNGATYSPNGSHLFITQENTSDKDVAQLFIHTIKKVKEIYNVDLHKEVIILDSDGEIDLKTFIERNK